MLCIASIGKTVSNFLQMENMKFWVVSPKHVVVVNPKHGVAVNPKNAVVINPKRVVVVNL